MLITTNSVQPPALPYRPELKAGSCIEYAELRRPCNLSATGCQPQYFAVATKKLDRIMDFALWLKNTSLPRTSNEFHSPRIVKEPCPSQLINRSQKTFSSAVYWSVFAMSPLVFFHWLLVHPFKSETTKRNLPPRCGILETTSTETGTS